MKTYVNYFILLIIVGLLFGCLRNSAEVNDPMATDIIPSSAAALATLTTIASPDLIQETPAPTDDLVVFPTPTNLVPTPDQQKQYKMENWTPQLANQVIAALRAYPDNLGFPERGYHDSGYYGASRYALFAEQEALLRFRRVSYGSYRESRGYRHLCRINKSSIQYGINPCPISEDLVQ